MYDLRVRVVEYEHDTDPLNTFKELIWEWIKTNQIKNVCEVGGGANPLLGLGFCKKIGIDYTIIDISETELEKAPEGYKKVCSDILDYRRELNERYDLVFSRMFAEHVSDGEKMHRNIFSMLKPGGGAIHIFPTLFALPFVINILLPESFGYSFIKRYFPGIRESSGRKGKFPAYYNWCRGPTRKQQNRFKKQGYIIVKYIGIFGHAGYYKPFPKIKKMHILVMRFLLDHPLALMTSFACVVLKKPNKE